MGARAVATKRTVPCCYASRFVIKRSVGVQKLLVNGAYEAGESSAAGARRFTEGDAIVGVIYELPPLLILWPASL